jgi:hypothetical protein
MLTVVLIFVAIIGVSLLFNTTKGNGKGSGNSPVGGDIYKYTTSKIPKDLSNLTEEQEYYIGDKVISLYARKGYDKFPIAGVYYRNLPLSTVGKFNGYAIAEGYNEYDKYAISIYDDAGLHLGYLPKGNKKLHLYISNNNGRVHAYGYIAYSNSIYGEVCVETNKDLVIKKNKPYGANVTPTK